MKLRRIRSAGLAWICVTAWLFFLNPNQANAQPPQFLEEHPNENRPPLPPYQSPTAPVLTAPPLISPSTEPLSAQARVFVRRFQLSGNTVFSDQDLAQVTAPYYWGHPFDQISNGGAEHDLQDRGVSFFMQVAYP